MQTASKNQKTLQSKADDVADHTSTGVNGLAIIPPAYGMDGVDSAVGAPTLQRKSAPLAGSDVSGEHFPNRTGLPDALKSGVEALSGFSMDDVRVHPNSSKPAQLQALAYAQGTDIHLAPGQERHLPHEAWHVVQQKQGRVKPTLQMKNTQINDDAGLEREADKIGIKASRYSGAGSKELASQQLPDRSSTQIKHTSVIQREYYYKGFDEEAQKFQDLYNGLQGSENRYLNFFKSEWGDAEITLDPKDDKVPGDARLMYRKEKDGAWSYGDINKLRELKTIYGIGTRVNIRKWFFDKYPVGKILAMAAHEIGVHIVPYMDELMEKLPLEAGVSKLIDKKNIDTSKQHGASGSIDHQRVARVDHVDFDLYRDVVKDMMNAMLKYNMKSSGEEKASDLADAYLMDISTFTKSGGRVSVPLQAGTIAAKYNNYRKEAKMEKDVPPKTGGDVIKDYANLYKQVYPTLKKQHPIAVKTTELVIFVLIMYLLYWLASKLFF